MLHVFHSLPASWDDNFMIRSIETSEPSSRSLRGAGGPQGAGANEGEICLFGMSSDEEAGSWGTPPGPRSKRLNSRLGTGGLTDWIFFVSYMVRPSQLEDVTFVSWKTHEL